MPFRDRPGLTDHGPAPAIRAVRYDLARLRPQIDRLRAQGCEIGVHGIDSWREPVAARREHARLTELTGQTDCGIRMHWLYFADRSPAVLDQAGYSYDSSCGYNQQVGYRAGTGQVFRPPGARRLLELPLHVMDTALFYPQRMALAPDQGRAAIRALITTAGRHGGTLTFNWHDRSLGPERFWGEVYRTVLAELRDHQARFLTAGQTVDWFRQRRAVRFDSVGHGTVSAVRVSGLTGQAMTGMVLRLHRPDGSHQDRPLTGSETVIVQPGPVVTG